MKIHNRSPPGDKITARTNPKEIRKRKKGEAGIAVARPKNTIKIGRRILSNIVQNCVKKSAIPANIL